LFLIASACGLIAANLYYAQPLIAPIAASLGLAPAAAGLIVTLTQIGYGAGLLLIVPLGDLVENRQLIVTLVSITALALVGAALSTRPLTLLLAALVIGGGSIAVQVLVGLAAQLAPEAVRGRAVGNVMSGLMLGIMLARPIAGFTAQVGSWHTIFFLSAIAMSALLVLLRAALPRYAPVANIHYGTLLRSMGELVRTTPILRRRSLYHACLFGAFSLFWTTTPLLLAGPPFHLSQGGIALFALAGVGGTVIAPVAGRFADRGWLRPATGAAIAAVAVSFLITHLNRSGSKGALALLVAAAILVDSGATMNMVLSQRAIFALGDEYRSRLNGIYMATFFAGGALGSAVGGWAYAHGGWTLASAFGLSLPLLALAYYATEWRQGRPT
jgi:predicted MFS family arabinose efflux permease